MGGGMCWQVFTQEIRVMGDPGNTAPPGLCEGKPLADVGAGKPGWYRSGGGWQS